jgi:hypothetical protein
MAKRKEKAGAIAKAAPKSNELRLHEKPGKTREQLFAQVAVEGTSGNAATIRLFVQPWMGELGLTESIHALRDELAMVKAGDMANVEGMLYGQARALEAVFHSCLNHAVANMGHYPDAMDRYMRLGLKAQSQCRTTLEALAEVKNPRAVAFVRQANIANGPQQVNNGRAEEAGSPPNELQEVIHGECMATGA